MTNLQYASILGMLILSLCFNAYLAAGHELLSRKMDEILSSMDTMLHRRRSP